MSLAGKFGNFEIKKSDRISQEDQAWLTHREELYKRAIMINKSVYDMYRAEYATYSEEDLEDYKYSSFLVGDFGVPKRIDEIQNNYISGIISYFANKYHVELENPFKPYDYSRDMYRYNKKDPIKELVVDIIDYHMVLDKIFDQLGGLSFKEKAEKEIKDKLREKCYNKYRDSWDIKIKGDKFSYTGGYCSKDAWSDRYKFHSVEWLHALLDALSYNTFDAKVSIPALDKLYGYSWIDLYEDDIQNGFAAISVGVKHIKFFKNGRVDITFKDAEFCRNFARDWCGYTLV